MPAGLSITLVCGQMGSILMIARRAGQAGKKNFLANHPAHFYLERGIVLKTIQHLIKQIMDFAIVGVIATVIDYMIFVFIYNLLGWHYNVATVIAFSLSTIFNYWASMKYVFKSKYAKEDRHREFMIFVGLSIIGLILNVVLMRFSVETLQIIPNIAKILVTGVVMVFNFVTRKLLLEGGSSLHED
ncbi:GtrA family protein [Eremococcus coleocola]|uniref:GtrA family protein n=1 Tax=Eremococcus coleocola TaxID=88132 RepID=UPI001B7FB40D|nr:GtrA family protein [Eremococcus coleocola]